MDNEANKIKTIVDVFPEQSEMLREDMPHMYELTKDTPYKEPRPEFIQDLLETCLKESDRLKAKQPDLKTETVFIKPFSSWAFISVSIIAFLILGFWIYHINSNQLSKDLIATNLPNNGDNNSSRAIYNPEKLAAINKINIKFTFQSPIINQLLKDITYQLNNSNRIIVISDENEPADGTLLISLESDLLVARLNNKLNEEVWIKKDFKTKPTGAEGLIIANELLKVLNS